MKKQVKTGTAAVPYPQPLRVLRAGSDGGVDAWNGVTQECVYAPK